MPLSADSPHTAGGGSGGREIKLFGVRIKVYPMEKSLCMKENEHLSNTSNSEGGRASGYASVDDAAPQPFAGSCRAKPPPSPWTEEEHKLFLIGLHDLRKGNWKGISNNYVKTRTPTQVASHAQKYSTSSTGATSIAVDLPSLTSPLNRLLQRRWKMLETSNKSRLRRQPLCLRQ
ncbi:transcription factor MYB1R1-like [Salvia divinorum]|uniref:Transcription factor MYB1R1-like n=1 Tax=Salvia divinorum TaxID=28513 RepID=A0ABD1HJL6_SALDI